MDIITKAKDIFDTAAVMTEDFIYDRKCDIKLAKSCAELKRAYEKFGRLSFRKLKGGKVDDAEYDTMVMLIDAIKAEIATLRDERAMPDDSECFTFEDDGEEAAEEAEENVSENENNEE